MIANIIDHRTDKYNSLCDAVLEPSWHDNATSPTGTQFPVDETFQVDYLDRVDVGSAIWYANNKWPDVPTTLFLYDYGSD
jgi:hypothetical protein